METAENQLQSLRDELNALRNENLYLYNELMKNNKDLSQEINSLREQLISIGKELANHHSELYQEIGFYGGKSTHDHLRKYLIRLSSTQTAEFILHNMLTLKAFDRLSDHLKYVLAHTSDNFGGGLFLEFGVFQGVSINFISETMPDKIVYGFDSFEGLPEDWRYDLRKGGFNLNGNLPRVNKNVRLVKGWFNETLPAFVKEHPEPCAFIHVDCDLYSSTVTILNELKNQIVSGTVIEFDEYFNYPGWQEGEYKAFMEFVAETGVEFEYISRTNDCRVAVKIK